MTTWLERVRATDEDLAAERPSKVLRSVKMSDDIDMETEKDLRRKPKPNPGEKRLRRVRVEWLGLGLGLGAYPHI